MPFPGAKVTNDILTPPSITQQERENEIPFPDAELYEKVRSRDSFKYGVDFRASYPCILNNEFLPTGSFFYPRDKNLAYNRKRSLALSVKSLPWLARFLGVSRLYRRMTV